MRRNRALLAAPLASLALTGCGGDDAGNPLDKALGYLPEDAPFVAAIDTDLEGDQFKAVDSILDKFPFGDRVKDEVADELEQTGIDVDEDLRPLLGNRFVVGAPDVDSFTGPGESEFVGAIQVEDEDKLEELVRKEGAKEAGESSGAKVYEDNSGDRFAIDGDVLVVADSRTTLEQGLEQSDGDGRLREDRFDEALADLPEEALVRVYGDVAALIEGDPATRDARKVPWVDALDAFGATASVVEDEISVQFKAETDSRDLATKDVPLATGADAPAVVGEQGQLAFALRDPRQVLEFAQRAAQAADPRGFGEFLTAKRQIERRAGVDVDRDLIGQLTGDLAVSVSLDGRFGARAELEDPRAFETALRQTVRELPALGTAQGRITPPPPGGDLYTFSEPDGDRVAFGVVDEVFVLSNDRARARELASASPREVSGAEGSIVFAANAEAVANEVVGQGGGLEGLAGRLVTRPLGLAIGYVRAETDGLSGSFRLEID